MVRTLPFHGAWVWSLIGELRSCKSKRQGWKKKPYSKEVHLSQGFWKRSELQFLLSQHPSQHPAGRCFKAHQFGNHEVRRPKHLPCLLTDSTRMRINVYGTDITVNVCLCQQPAQILSGGPDVCQITYKCFSYPSSTLAPDPSSSYIPLLLLRHLSSRRTNPVPFLLHAWQCLCLWHPAAWWVQWIRIQLPMQGTRVRSLVWEDSTCHRGAKLVRHNYWACCSRARELQLLKLVPSRTSAPPEKPARWEALAPKRERSPRSPQPEKACMRLWRPSTAKNKNKYIPSGKGSYPRVDPPSLRPPLLLNLLCFISSQGGCQTTPPASHAFRGLCKTGAP